MEQKKYPDRTACEELLCRYGTPENIIAHGRAVARCALALAAQGTRPVDAALLEAACLLHDIARREKDHALVGAAFLEARGHGALAALVRTHHDLPEEHSEEAALLYLADKLVEGTRRVSLEERFALSRQKCHTPEALQAWQRRYEQARRILDAYENTPEEKRADLCQA